MSSLAMSLESKIPVCHEGASRPGVAARRLRRLRTETRGQDLIEYALMAGFVAVAAGAIFPAALMPSVSTIFSKLGSYFALAASSGGGS